MSLYEFMRNHPQLLALPDVTRAIARQMVTLVAELHEQGLTHRCVDIVVSSPGCIL